MNDPAGFDLIAWADHRIRAATWPERQAWLTTARPTQLEPDGTHSVWFFIGGRGAGKTRAGAAWAAEQAELEAAGLGGAVIGPTFGDTRDVMVEGPSGLLRALGDRVESYNRSQWEITTKSGARIYMRSADQPARLRGLNLAWAWADEIGYWRRSASWYEGLVPALRIGGRPRIVATSTPKRTDLVRDLMTRTDGSVIVTTDSTFANAENLSATALEELRRRYEGTRLGRQELYGELLDEIEGALWTRAGLEATRLQSLPFGAVTAIGVDPSVSRGGDESGVVAVAGWSVDGAEHLAPLADYTVPTGDPLKWAQAAVDAYRNHQALVIVPEKNQGGLMVEQAIRQIDPNVNVDPVHAADGKRTRAQPVAMLWEQGRGHVVGMLPELEDQMTGWVEGEPSPDRMDAFVHAATWLLNRPMPVQEFHSTVDGPSAGWKRDAWTPWA